MVDICPELKAPKAEVVGAESIFSFHVSCLMHHTSLGPPPPSSVSVDQGMGGAVGRECWYCGGNRTV